MRSFMSKMRGGSSGPPIIHSTKNCIVASSPVNVFNMNQYLIGCLSTKTAFLLDCGDKDAGPWLSYKIPNLQDKEGRGHQQQPTETRDKTTPIVHEEDSFQIKGVFQTHCHLDHIAGLQPTMEALPEGTPIYYHEGDAVWLKDPFHGLGMAEAFPALNPPVVIPAKQDKRVSEGDRISVGNLEFEVIFVPGHTPGQVIFYCAAEKIAFVGDLIFQGSVGRSDLPFSDPEVMQLSLKKAVEKLPDDVTIFSGHGEKTTMGMEKRTNPYIRPLAVGSKL